MAYFQLSAPTKLKPYPFDYHSHLGGILPVRDKDMPSLARWVNTEQDDDPGQGEYLLFVEALQFMRASNPFSALINRGDTANYERAECGAENIYVACVLLAQQLCPRAELATLAATDSRLYTATEELLQSVWRKKGAERTWLVDFLKYFNGKIFSSNKYTPFDDAYKTRSSMLDRVRTQDPDGEKRYVQFLDLTLEYLLGQGICGIQIPASRDDIPHLDQRMVQFNKDRGTCYRALVHTPAAYLGKAKLAAELKKLKELLASTDYPCTIGLDLLGVENKVADYAALFEFLLEEQKELAKAYGKGGKQSDHLIVHVHNGEGAGSGADNRSLIGYYLAYGNRSPDADFYAALSDYIARCARAARDRQATESQGTHGAHGFKPNGVSGLFDELFRNNSFTYGGCRLRRFDINGQRSAELVAYNGKRSVMALSETFDTEERGASWYQLLASTSSLYRFRLGHDYYYRNYMAAKYPALAFDTNLGSNAITGAAGLFGSSESYQINRGFRHLDGYIETDVLATATTSAVYMSTDVLDAQKIQCFLQISRGDRPIKDVLEEPANVKTIKDFLEAALEGVARPSKLPQYYDIYRKLVIEIVGAAEFRMVRYQAMARVYTVFRNWRCYLLGADGQGVEHSNIQDEFLRMLILLAYNLLPAGQERLNEKTMEHLQELLLSIAEDYWVSTVGEVKFDFETIAPRGIQRLEGYKSPASVITLRREAAGGR